MSILFVLKILLFYFFLIIDYVLDLEINQQNTSKKKRDFIFNVFSYQLSEVKAIRVA